MKIWTDPMTWEEHEKGKAGEMNQYVRDNEEWLKENIELGEADKLNIINGTLTITKSNHTVDTEDGTAPESNLNTIAGADKGRILILHSADNSRVVILKNGPNLILGEDIYLDDTNIYVMLICDSAGNWHPLNILPSY